MHAHSKRVLVLTVVALALTICSDIAFATSGFVFLQPKGRSVPEAFPTLTERPFDVKSYDLTLDWREAFAKQHQVFSGKNIITLRLTQNTPNIVLDAALMEIDSVTINGVAVVPVPQPDANEHLTIALANNFRQTTSDLVVAISYHRTDQSNRGAFYYPKGLYVGTLPSGDTVRVLEDILYTMSEPLDACAWMPCMNLPYDKANSDITIIAPNGITTASNGALIEKKAFDTSSMLWHWRSDRPIATYLMVADASTFTHWTQTHQRSADPADTVSLGYYVWPADYGQDSITDGTAYNARYSFKNTSSIMTNFESRYGAFPFEKYGQVAAQPFDYGGMEHQSLTTINRSWIRISYDVGIAHEMAHQWFGDKVTCRSFKDIWLNEGFATYSEAIWYEGWGGNDWYMAHVRDMSGDYFRNGDTTLAIYDPPGSYDLFDHQSTTALFYSKAGAVIHMLRRLVHNDDKFFAAIRTYLDSFAYASATTEDFRRVMSAQLGIDLTTYFNEWFYGPGHPIYSIRYGQSSSNVLNVEVDQEQSMQDHFTMPVHLFAYHGGVVDTLTMMNDSRSQHFTFWLSYKADSLVFDDDALVLSKHKLQFDPSLDAPMAADAPAGSLRASFDQSARAIFCTVSNIGPSRGIVRVYNSLGVKVAEHSASEGQTSWRLDASSLPNGIYIVRFEAGRTNLIAKVNILR